MGALFCDDVKPHWENNIIYSIVETMRLFLLSYRAHNQLTILLTSRNPTSCWIIHIVAEVIQFLCVFGYLRHCEISVSYNKRYY